MDDKLINADLILQWIKDQIESKQPIDPGLWVEISQKLNILKADEDDKVADLQQVVAQKRVALLEAGKNVSYAKTMIEASDEYKHYLKQKAKIERIEEAIRLSKTQAKLASENYKNIK